MTEILFLRPGWNRFVWSLSNAFCEGFSRDTVAIWNPIPIEAVSDNFGQVTPGEAINVDLLFNDVFLSEGYTFQPSGFSGDDLVHGFSFDESIGQYTGFFDYVSNKSRKVTFDYELCDARCAADPIFCDTASFEAVICARSVDEATFYNGFDPLHLKCLIP